MTGPLNLSDADTSGFDALEAGRYNAEVFEVKWDAVKNTSGTGKMPAGTPMMKVQFKLVGEGPDGKSVENRRVFTQFVNPPSDYAEKEKAAKMRGMIVRFFVAIGFEESVVKNKGFDPDFDELKGIPCVVTVKKEPKKNAQGEIVPEEYNNPVSGVKPAGTIVGAPAGGLL